jgi:hypothetical protein
MWPAFFSLGFALVPKGSSPLAYTVPVSDNAERTIRHHSHMSPVASLSVSPCTVLAKDSVRGYIRVRMPRSFRLLIYRTKTQGDDGNRWHSIRTEMCVQYWTPLDSSLFCLSTVCQHSIFTYSVWFSERTGIITINRINRLVFGIRDAEQWRT